MCEDGPYPTKTQIGGILNIGAVKAINPFIPLVNYTRQHDAYINNIILKIETQKRRLLLLQ